jgi:hypothetical protein
MTTPFIENESYMHKMAKEVLKKWFEETETETDGGGMCIGGIGFRSNRKSGIFLEYPICTNITTTWPDPAYQNLNSWEKNWDEIADEEGKYFNEYVPTYDECVEIYKSYPIAIIDVVCSHKGSPSICIEICHKNPVSQTKINKLKEIGVDSLIEIDAEWILKQTKRPSKLKYKILI